MSTNNYAPLYWVTSNGDAPERIYFDFGDAIASGSRYIDSFDANGNHLAAYCLNKSGVYDTDF